MALAWLWRGLAIYGYRGVGSLVGSLMAPLAYLWLGRLSLGFGGTWLGLFYGCGDLGLAMVFMAMLGLASLQRLYVGNGGVWRLYVGNGGAWLFMAMNAYGGFAWLFMAMVALAWLWRRCIKL